MDPKHIPVDLIKSAMETYHLAKLVEGDTEAALKEAIGAVLESHRVQVIAELGDVLSTYSDMLSDNAENPAEELAADYILYCSDMIRGYGPPDVEIAKYTPNDGDVIQVVATGHVIRDPNDSPYWRVVLDRGDELNFNLRRDESDIRVRLIEEGDNENAEGL